MTNFKNTTLYIGITNNLIRRVNEHRVELMEGFTKRYHITKLVFYEIFNTPEEAISSEKKIKGWTRVKKEKLISDFNSTWEDHMRRSFTNVQDDYRGMIIDNSV